MGRIVGIDFGTARIGLAITDEMRIITQPLATIQAAKNVKQTVELIAKELERFKKIDTIVVGLPLLLSGKEGDMASLAKAFGAAVEKRMGVPVVYWDERLTSSQVDRMLRDSDVSRKKRATLSDQLAAAAILQNYMDSLP
ncbi:MAG: Holliday junction resolvase RuvX [Chlamydiota bacterium]